MAVLGAPVFPHGNLAFSYRFVLACLWIRIVSEFDTPAHSAVFIDNNSELGFDGTNLDIRLNSDKKETVYKFIADLYEEYMGGDNPVFVTDAFNVGLDEYNSAYKEDMTQYTQYVMDLVYNKYGKTPMAWASMV